MSTSRMRKRVSKERLCQIEADIERYRKTISGLMPIAALLDEVKRNGTPGQFSALLTRTRIDPWDAGLLIAKHRKGTRLPKDHTNGHRPGRRQTHKQKEASRW